MVGYGPVRSLDSEDREEPEDRLEECENGFDHEDPHQHGRRMPWQHHYLRPLSRSCFYTCSGLDDRFPLRRPFVDSLTVPVHEISIEPQADVGLRLLLLGDYVGHP
jgi:hypothetical protein